MELQSHKLNEKKKRLEPIETECSFCMEKHMKKMNTCSFIPLFQESKRTNLIAYRSVKFSKIDVGIPRCSKCQEVHESAITKAYTITVPLGIVLGIAFYFILGLMVNKASQLVFGGFGGFFIALLTIFVPTYDIANFLVKKEGVMTEKDLTKSYPLIQGFLANGWSTQQPTA